MKTLLIVYHSLTGGSGAMAQALASGSASEEGVKTLLLHANEANSRHLLESDGYVFITPETLGSMAGLMKDFFDRTYYPALGQVNGKPYVALVCTHAQTPEEIAAPKLIKETDLQQCRELGAAMAAGLVMGLF